jgi:hypothetical protein
MFFSLQSAHYAQVVQELYGLNVLMLVESSFMLSCNILYFSRHNIHLQTKGVITYLQHINNSLQETNKILHSTER